MAQRRPAGWRIIADDIRDAITRGDHPAGATLPRHDELARRYGVSRPTVHRAIAELTAEGLVTHVRWHGTVVLPRPLRLAVARYSTVVDPDRARPDLGPWETACHQHGIRGRSELVAVATGSVPDVAARLGVAPDVPLTRRDRRMWAGEFVAQLQSAWYPPAVTAAAGLDRTDRITGGVYGALVAAGITPTTADEEVSARLATTAETERMHIAERQPVLDIWRTTRASGTAVEVVHIAATAAAVSLLYSDLPIGPARRDPQTNTDS